MDLDKVICSCRKVTRRDVADAMEKGARKFKEVRELTGAGSKCGRCKEDVKAFMKKYARKEKG